jgi:secondary thiamine-phosphate synthase enzyme
MEILAASTVCRHTRIRLTTSQPLEFIDLTDRVETAAAAAGICTGLVNVQSRHALLDRAAAADAGYRHDDLAVRTVNLTPDERRNGHAHCRALLLGSAVAINVAEGRLQLGRWQRVFLVELDGPREREISVLVMGEVGR